MKQFRILVVDDEERILHFLRSKLRASGYDVIVASDGAEALEKLYTENPDLIVLDLLMPRMDGFEFLHEVRTYSALPVIILSARDADTDKIKGLRLGADDYLPKPFNPDELVARIEAVRRRTRPAPAEKSRDLFTTDRLTIDFRRRSVVVDGEETHLTQMEWLLLSELANNAGRLMLYEELLTRVWGAEYRNDMQILRTWVSRLRYKLEEDPREPRLIRTIPKAGYILDAASS